MRRILVLRRGAFGDTLLLLPLLRALRRRWPAAELAVAGVAEFAAVLAEHGAAAALSSEDLGLWALASVGERAARAQQRLRHYDLVIADQELPAFPGAPLVLRLQTERLLAGVPAGRQFVQQLAGPLGLVSAWPADAWFMPPTAPGPGPLWLAPGSGSAAKCWPRGHWLALAARLAAAGVPLGVVVGPAEAERGEVREWPWPAGAALLAERTPVELARSLGGARGFVGNDSGPTHLAAMLGVPTVAVFGPTDPAVWAPPGPHVQVCGGCGVALRDVTVDAVLAAVPRG